MRISDWSSDVCSSDLPFTVASGQPVSRQYRLRDLVRAIDAAKDDAKVKAIVLDLDHFQGGYPAALSEVGDALGRVRASGKPVLAYATAYTDAGYRLAAERSEEHTSELQSLMRQSYAGFYLKKKNK